MLNFQLITYREAQKSILLAYMPHESVKESNKGSKEGLGPTLGVHFTDLTVSLFKRCPLRESTVNLLDTI